MVSCRQCGAKHFTINCPLRTPEERPKPWKQQQDEFFAREESKPYKCTVRLHPGKEARICSDNVEQFWSDIQVSIDHSLYRDFAGLQKAETNMLFPPNHPNLESGEYIAVSRTHAFDDQQLFSIIADGVANLKKHRPFSPETFKRVQAELLLLFNHFSLSHEGNALGFDETKMLSDLLVGKDWKRALEDNEDVSESLRISGSDHDIKEASNHILVSQYLQEICKYDITETVVLQLHSGIMCDLLVREEEGLPGEYRKVPLGVEGSTVGRPCFDDIAPLMKKFFEQTMIQKQDEDIIEFLARVHAQFQYIHPFRDGNGRMGRLIMNLHLMKHGYPVLVLPTTMSSMFNHAVEMGHRGDLTLFTRLLAESIFSSLQVYANALEVQLLPSIEETIELVKAVGETHPVNVVSP